MYKPENQYRCTIIRGKSQQDMENLLAFYAQMVTRYCPCNEDEFNSYCNRELAKKLFQTASYETLPDSNKKTIRNHLTEIAGKLLGLYWTSEEGIVYATEACNFLIEKADFPAYFKNLCLNFQFPNGTQKIQTIKERLDAGINFRPFCYIVALLYYAQSQPEKYLLTKQEIGYYVLNNLDVLQGKVSYKEVYTRIIEDRKNKVRRPALSGSHDWQHIKEQFNLLELSNIVCVDREFIWLNKNEAKAVQLFLAELEKPLFDICAFDLETPSGVTSMYSHWEKYFGTLNPKITECSTHFDSSSIEIADASEMLKKRGAVGLTTTEMGDQGEALVYKLECERIKNYKERLVNKVLLLGKTKGLGYDISSIEGSENPKHPEYARYIEVKTTIRVTEPTFNDIWSDSLNLTAKEWIAAEQYGAYYNIYRVYLTKTRAIIVRINNPYQKADSGEIEVYPTIYQMNFGKESIELKYNEAIS